MLGQQQCTEKNALPSKNGGQNLIMKRNWNLTPIFYSLSPCAKSQGPIDFATARGMTPLFYLIYMHKICIIKRMEFEFDPAKAKGNLKKHGVSFSHAEQALRDERAVTIDDPEHHAEQRF